MGALSIEQIADEMAALVREAGYAKVLTPSDLVQTMMARFGHLGCTKADCKRALRLLIESGRAVYGEFCDTYVTLPQTECAARPKTDPTAEPKP
jgi:hypothetical protein